MLEWMLFYYNEILPQAWFVFPVAFIVWWVMTLPRTMYMYVKGKQFHKLGTATWPWQKSDPMENLAVAVVLSGMAISTKILLPFSPIIVLTFVLFRSIRKRNRRINEAVSILSGDGGDETDSSKI